MHLHWINQHHSKCWIAVGILPYGSRHSLLCVHLHWDIQLPHVRCNEPASQNFYSKLEQDKVAERTELRRYETKEDIDVYLPILMEVITLFGIAIHTSLERTMGKYLKATDGVFRNELREEWQLEKVAQLL